MTTRVALLRGINLGSHKKVPMAELRDLATDIGFIDPKTYVQSGNLVFETDLDESAATTALETALERRFAFEVPVIFRSADEIAEVASSHPFADLDLEDRFLAVAFLDRTPVHSMESSIDPDDYTPDRLIGEGREVYLAYPRGSGRSRLNHSLLERRLGVSVTIRNWRTVSKLAEMTASRGVPRG